MEFNRALLRSFCGDDERRPVTRAPWSVGAYSYATDGGIIVRVARHDDVPLADDSGIKKTAARINEWLAVLDPVERVAVPKLTLPEGATERCKDCDGRGHEHDCPDCGCTCRECDGMGNFRQPVLVAWRGIFIARKHWRLIQALPNGTIAAHRFAPEFFQHISFAFDGGVGLTLPTRKRLNETPLIVEAEPAEATP